MLVVVPGRSWASAAGSTTWARSVTGPGDEADRDHEGGVVEGPLGQPAIGEVGQRVGAEEDERAHAGPGVGIAGCRVQDALGVPARRRRHGTPVAAEPVAT